MRPFHSRSEFWARADYGRIVGHPANEPPHALEYLGTLRAETGTRTVIENGPQGTRTIVQAF